MRFWVFFSYNFGAGDDTYRLMFWPLRHSDIAPNNVDGIVEILAHLNRPINSIAFQPSTV
jgi:hypothetical protein